MNINPWYSTRFFLILVALLNLQQQASAQSNPDKLLSWILWRKPVRIPSSSSSSPTKTTRRRRGDDESSLVHVVTNPSQHYFSYYARVALAGGLAGATGTMLLYPMDSAKTLRQSNPTQFSSVRAALYHVIRLPSGGSWRIGPAYRGWLPAALGAIPSSALYFGAYESCKRILNDRFGGNESKWWIHGLAAASGNTISSAVFVPKEVLKQRMQYSSSTLSSSSSLLSVSQALTSIVREKGIRGLYVGYQATLMRNIPSAMVRFVLYEELKQFWLVGKTSPTGTVPSTSSSPTTERSIITQLRQSLPPPVGLFVAGAVAGAVASGVMTPIDVIKTRLATGTCPVGVQNCFRHVVQEMGWRGLYAGAGSRMVWSGAFSAIGFGTFEGIKGVLGVATPNNNNHPGVGCGMGVGVEATTASYPPIILSQRQRVGFT